MKVFKTDHVLKTFYSGVYQKQFCLKCKAATGWYTSFDKPNFGFAPLGFKSERGF